MKKAVLKTLIYADIFDYPLKINELHKWLIGKKITIRQLEEALGKLVDRLQVTACLPARQGYREFYCLPKKTGLATKRVRKEKQSEIYFKKAKMLAQALKLIPWVKLVGISGGLAMKNAGKIDDIDLFIITQKNRLWISRLLCLGLLSLLGQRRKVGERGRKIAGKVCINILVEEDKLEQKNKDIYVAHEVLQMQPLWYRDEMYSRYLADNEWVFKFLPNWVEAWAVRQSAKNRSHGRNLLTCEDFVKNHKTKSFRQPARNPQHFLATSGFAAFFVDCLNDLAKRLQLKIMQKPKGLERIEEGALYFHPEDCRLKILSQYRQKLKKYLHLVDK